MCVCASFCGVKQGRIVRICRTLYFQQILQDIGIYYKILLVRVKICELFELIVDNDVVRGRFQK